MRYLITGGAGFIGSHLARALVGRDHEVVALDNLSTGTELNLSGLGDEPNFEFVHGSVLDSMLVDELVSRVDIVVHLAAAVGVKLIIDQPLKSLTTNIRGAEIVLDAAWKRGVKTLMTSTSEIYGKNSSGPLSETSDRILGPPSVARWAYSTSKAVDEIQAQAYFREKGLPTIIVRLFNTVGPRQTGKYGMVMPRLIDQALSGSDLTVYGDGTQTRCFCLVDDVVEALMLLLDSDAAVGDIFNVGSPEEVSISELAKDIIFRTGSSSSVRIIPYDDAYEEGFEDMQRRVPDITKINQTLGWKPEASLGQILERMIEYARSQRS
jgi:UDP-glucose 4-epimerase